MIELIKPENSNIYLKLNTKLHTINNIIKYTYKLIFIDNYKRYFINVKAN